MTRLILDKFSGFARNKRTMGEHYDPLAPLVVHKPKVARPVFGKAGVSRSFTGQAGSRLADKRYLPR